MKLPRFSLAAMMVCVTAMAVAFWISVSWPVIYMRPRPSRVDFPTFREPITSEIVWRLVFLGPLALVAARMLLVVTRRWKR
jgi:hypothetical protein